MTAQETDVGTYAAYLGVPVWLPMCGVSVWLHYLEPLGVALLLLNGRGFAVARILEC